MALFLIPIVNCPNTANVVGVIYASTLCDAPRDRELLSLAVKSLLYQVDSDESETKVLWSMYYEQRVPASEEPKEGLFSFPPSSFDLAFDDGVVETVRDAWRFVLGYEAKDEDFLCFPDREGEEPEEDMV
jgi:Rab proteins geranylgeranyltransferase component A